ncbi:hypothetical protein D9756_002315 [Leucocoprinus leucothites]|uniref:Nicotinamide N-methyltransferase n=1 Tax=Leucocoprinus leucothites TaxID=201217 RepID=A0A8H5LLM7_9AGAR|nr:hypothetical protein D9756_002315 [Leucoagaricus leucothites]
MTTPVSTIRSQPSQSNTSLPPGDGNAHEHDDNPEDILFDALQTLYDYQPVTFTSAGASYTYTYPRSLTSSSIKITLRTPDTDAVNWSLHASSVWIASTQLANGINFLRIDHHLQRIGSGGDGTKEDPERPLRLLELGASAGLPSILIARVFPDVSVVASDYPDSNIIRTLTQNIRDNGAEANCHAAPFGWGTDPSPLFSLGKADGVYVGFDLIIAADTLWNPDLHSIFIDTLQRTLRRDRHSRVHLVAGLHTGRYTIDSFLRSIRGVGFRVLEIMEREVTAAGGGEKAGSRQWDVARAEYEEEKDRRGWVIWIEICWEECYVS